MIDRLGSHHMNIKDENKAFKSSLAHKIKSQ